MTPPFDRTLLLLAAILGFTGVAAGAFGAHALAQHLDATSLAAFETGVRYQLFHAPVIALCAVCAARAEQAALQLSGGGRVARTLRFAGVAFAAGIVLFSGSLYALALGSPRWVGAITPFGGTALLIGWGALAWAALKCPSPADT